MSDKVAAEAAAAEKAAPNLKARRQTVARPGGTCDLRFGTDPLETLGKDLRVFAGKPRMAVLLSSAAQLKSAPVRALYDEARRQLADGGFEAHSIELGEEHGCNVETANVLFGQLEELGITADDILVAVGDTPLLSLAAFVAGSWCGGMTFTVVPTSFTALLGIVTPSGLAVGQSADMVSIASWPRMANADLAMLAELSEADARATFSLFAAAAMTDGEAAIGRLSGAVDALVSRDLEALQSEGTACLRSRGKTISSTAVAVRSGVRYGTTFARALASMPGVSETPAELLADGLRFESRVSAGLEKLSVDDVLAQDDLLDRLGLTERGYDVEPAALLRAMQDLARKRQNRFQMALPHAVGRVRLTPVDDDMLAEHVEAWCEVRREMLQA